MYKSENRWASNMYKLENRQAPRGVEISCYHCKYNQSFRNMPASWICNRCKYINIIITCVKCKNQYKIPSETNRIKCPSCNTQIHIIKCEYCDNLYKYKANSVCPSCKKNPMFKKNLMCENKPTLYIFSTKYIDFQTKIIKQEIEKYGIEVIISQKSFNKSDYNLVMRNPNAYVFLLYSPTKCSYQLPENKFFYYQYEQYNTKEKRQGTVSKNINIPPLRHILSYLKI